MSDSLPESADDHRPAEAPARRRPEGRALDEAVHDLPPRQPSMRYAILSLQRTGSNYLSRRLCNVRDRFGLPSEYLHAESIRVLADRLMPVDGPGPRPSLDLNAYLDALERVRTTADGVFGTKIQPAQLLGPTRGSTEPAFAFLRRFDRIVMLSRRDRLGQAVSGALAQVSGQWFTQGEEPALGGRRIASLFPDIAHKLARYIDEERFLATAARTVERPMIRIEYEDLQADPQAVFQAVTAFLCTPDPVGELDEDASLLPVPEKPPGELAARVRAAFLAHIGVAGSTGGVAAG